jgi:hypothetical protein
MEQPLTAIERIVEEAELAARNPKFAARRELARWCADSGHAEGYLGLKARGSSVHAEAHRSEATLSS